MEFFWNKIVITVVSIFMILLTILYWYVLIAFTGFSFETPETAIQVIMYILSIVFLCILGMCGCFVAWKEYAKCMGNWSMMVCCVGILAIIQIIITIVSYGDCGDNESSQYVCQQDAVTAVFTIFIPFTLLFVCSVVGCLTMCHMLRTIEGEDGRYY